MRHRAAGKERLERGQFVRRRRAKLAQLGAIAFGMFGRGVE
jgi:hypothetical protein